MDIRDFILAMKEVEIYALQLHFWQAMYLSKMFDNTLERGINDQGSS